MRILFLLVTLFWFSLSDPARLAGDQSNTGTYPGVTVTLPQNPTDTRNDLAKVAGQWAKYWQAKQLEQIAALYAEDAVFLTGQGDRFTGKSAIRDIFKKALETNSSNITVRSIRTEVAGTLAYDSGEYQEVITPAGGEKRELTGNYIIVFRKQNGKWLIVEHAWTDKPAKN
jgi:uncharacterized protein (TIGR02246 family)